MKLSVPILTNMICYQLKVLKSEWISTFVKTVNIFEDKLARYCRTKFSVALNSELQQYIWV